MLGKISEKITNRLLYKKVIDFDDYDIYQYGIEQVLMNMIYSTLLIILGFIFGVLWQGVIFVFSFMFLRSFAGGYHAHTPLSCCFLTTLVITAGLSVIKYVEINNFVCVVLLFLSSVVILLFSPVESKNKKLDDVEKVIYRKKVIMVWCIETGMAISSFFLKLDVILLCIVMAQFVLSLALLIEILRQRLN